MYEVEWPTRKEIYIHVLQRAGWIAGSALSQAAQHDDIPFAKWVVAHYYTATGNSSQYALQYSINTAGKHGCVAILRWLLKRLRAPGKCDDFSEVMFAAAENGKVEVVKWLCATYAQNLSVDLFQMKKFSRPTVVLAMDVAASQGHVKVLEILQNVKILSRDFHRPGSFRHQRQQPQCTRWAMDSAAFAGHLDVLQWLHSNRSEGCTTAAMDKAAVNGHVEVVKWLSQNRSEGCSSWALDMVASKSAQGSNDMTAKAFNKKQFEIIQWMYQNSTSRCTSAAMAGAAANENLDMLKWLHKSSSAGFTSKAMDMAAENGHLDIIEWLHSLKYSTCTTAGMDNAASNGHLDIVKWLHMNRSEGCTHAAMDRAAANGHLNVLTWLHQNRLEGCTTNALDSAADSGNFKVAKWLLANRSEGVASTALGKAAKNGHLHLVRYLSPRRTVQELVSGVREAAEHEHFEVVLFLDTLCLKDRHVDSIQPVLRRAFLSFRGDNAFRRWLDENSKDEVGPRVIMLPQ